MKLLELDLEQFKKDGVDNELKNPKKYWRELIAGLRYLGNSAYPALSKGKVWGEWKLEDAERYFAKIVDTLRRINFPIIPKKEDSSYFELYKRAEKYMETAPPKEDELDAWEKKREEWMKEFEKVKEQRQNLNAPSFAYKAVYGKEKFIQGRADHKERNWKNVMVDIHIKEEWLESLNSVPGIEIRSSGEGDSPERVSFIVFRFKDSANEKKAEQVSTLISQNKSYYSITEVGTQGKKRIVVAGKTYYGDKSYDSWWSNLAGKIKAAVDSAKEKADKHSESKKGVQTFELIESDEVELEEGVRPAFGSPGGKRYLAKTIVRYIPEHKIYVESFIGGGAVFFKKKPSEKEVINDYDFQIYNAYKVLKDSEPSMIRKSSDQKDWIAKEDKIRSAWKNKTEGIAGFFEYLYGLRGSFSRNRKSISNTGLGTSLKPSFSNLEEIKERLSKVKILSGDYSKTFRFDSKETFFYLDPPYPGEWPKETKEDKFDLKVFVEKLKSLKGKFIVSIDTDNRKFFEDNNWHFKKVKRITTFTRPDQQKEPDKRDYDTELLVANFPFKKSNQWLAESEQAEQEIQEGMYDKLLLENGEKIKSIGPVVVIPDYVSWSGSYAFSPGRKPNDIEWIVRDSRITTGEMLKLERISGKLFPGVPPHFVPAMEGPNWRFMPVYDLALIPKDSFKFHETDKEGFRKMFYESYELNEQVPRAASPEIKKQAEQSKKEDKIKLGRFFMMMKPVRVTIPKERQSIENLSKYLKPESYEAGWYCSKKMDGMAIQIHKNKQSVKIFSEDGEELNGLTGIEDAVRKLKPDSLIICCELEYWEKGKHGPREQVAGEVHKKEPDDTNMICGIFELVYYNGEDLHKKGYAEHKKILDSISWPQSTDGIPDVKRKLNLIPDYMAKSESEIKRVYETLRKKPASEGFVIKRADAPYYLDVNSRNMWFKLHENTLLHGIVIQRIETKTKGVFNYRYGIDKQDYSIAEKNLIEVEGKEYLEVGKTFSGTDLLKAGEILEVEAETINFIKDERNDTVSVTAWAPRYFGRSDWKNPDSIDAVVSRARKDDVLMRKTIDKEGNTIYEAADPFMDYPDEDKDWEYVAQHHYRGKSCHTDLRFEQKDFLVGWTLFDLMADKIKEAPESLSAGKALDKKDIWKIDWKTGEFKKRETKAGVVRATNIRSTQKAKEPLPWLKFEGVSPKGEVGATKEYPGVFTIIDKGRVEYGSQRPWSHEYFLSGGKLKGKYVFRLIGAEEKESVLGEGEIIDIQEISVLPPGTPEEKARTPFFWVMMQPVNQTPYVLTKGAIDKDWLPPKGVSALPEKIRKQVPVNLQYWKTSGKKALEMRKQLVESKIIKTESLSEADPKFILQHHWWRGTIQIRFGPSTEHWDLRIKKDSKYWHLVLKDNPIENDRVAGYEKPMKDPAEAMEKGKDGTEFLEPGTEWNPTKDTPAFVKALDWGDCVILEDKPTIKKIQFKGKKFKNVWFFRREAPDSDFWEMSVSELPELKKESKTFIFPLEIKHNNKKYVVRETRSGKLIMN